MKIIIKIIIAATALGIITLFLFCAVPAETDWHKTVKCYKWGDGAPDLSLPNDTKLDGLLDYIEVKCNFTVYHTITYTLIKEGTVEFYGRKYGTDTYGNNMNTAPGVTTVVLHNDYNSGVTDSSDPYWVKDSMYLSSDRKYIEIYMVNFNGNETFYGIGGCETIGEIKDAVKALGHRIPSEFDN